MIHIMNTCLDFGWFHTPYNITFIAVIQIWKKDGREISLRYELNAKASCLSLSWYPCPKQSSAMDAANTNFIAWYLTYLTNYSAMEANKFQARI